MTRSPLLFKPIVVLLAASVLMGGCAVQRQVHAKVSAAAQAAEKLKPPRAPLVVEVVRDTPWLMGEAIAPPRPQPKILSTDLALMTQDSWSLDSLARYATDQTGVHIAISPSAEGAAPVRMSYSGSLAGFLDQACGTGLHWRMREDGTVEIYRTRTETFTIPALFWQTKTDAKMTSASTMSQGASSDSTSGTGAVGGASGTGTISAENTTQGNTWGDLLKTAQAIAGKTAEVVTDPSDSTLVVTGTPEQLSRVARWVKRLSQSLQRQVALDVRMYSVQINHEDNVGFNPAMVLNTLGRHYGFTITGTSAPPVGSGASPVTFGASVLTPTTPGLNNTFAGTSGVLQALATLGRTSLVLSQSTVTLNGQPAPIQSVLQTGYLARSSTEPSITAGIAPTTTLIPGSVTTGFTAMLLPRVVDGNVLLGMNFTLSTLLGLNPSSATGASIQTPTVSLSTAQQSVRLKPGQTLMLTGLQQSTAKSTDTGVGTPKFKALGGGTDAQLGKQLLVILVTARLV